MEERYKIEFDSKHVFSEIKGELFIGGEKIKPDMRKLLKEQAGYLESSQIYELLRATITQEAAELALSESKEWNHVLYAKALKYWGDVFDTMIKKLQQ